MRKWRVRNESKIEFDDYTIIEGFKAIKVEE